MIIKVVRGKKSTPLGHIQKWILGKAQACLPFAFLQLATFPKAAVGYVALGTAPPTKIIKKALLDVPVFGVFCEALNKENCRRLHNIKGKPTRIWPMGECNYEEYKF